MTASQAQAQAQAEAVEEALEAAGRRAGKSAAAFRTISEVASDLDVPPHVLRFWESKFSQIKPLKRGGGRRYYRPEDIELLRRIRTLLYRDGYTIKGVQKLLRSPGVRPVTAEDVAGEADGMMSPGATADSALPDPVRAIPPVAAVPAAPSLDPQARALVEAALEELSQLRDWLANRIQRS